LISAQGMSVAEIGGHRRELIIVIEVSPIELIFRCLHLS